MKLSGNVILVTGGASGIGFALATRFVKAGSQVIICGRRQEQLEIAKKECPTLVTIPADISEESSREELFAEVTRRFPNLNVVINNAGIQNRPPPLKEKQDWSKHRQEIATNLEAPMHLSMLFIPHLLLQNRPYLMNLTSGLAFAPISFMPTYCLTKAALHSFTLAMRHQLKDTPIRVVEIAPPAVQTDLGGKGLHSHAADLDGFADHCIQKLAAGELEFGYESSEKRRLAVANAIKPFFDLMNP